GFTEVLSTGRDTRWMSVSTNPTANPPAAGGNFRCPVESTTNTSSAVMTISVTTIAVNPKPPGESWAQPFTAKLASSGEKPEMSVVAAHRTRPAPAAPEGCPKRWRETSPTGRFRFTAMATDTAGLIWQPEILQLA